MGKFKKGLHDTINNLGEYINLEDIIEQEKLISDVKHELLIKGYSIFRLDLSDIYYTLVSNNKDFFTVKDIKRSDY